MVQTKRNATRKGSFNVKYFPYSFVPECGKMHVRNFSIGSVLVLNWIWRLGFLFRPRYEFYRTSLSRPPSLFFSSPQSRTSRTTREINQIAISKEQIAVLFTGYKNFTTFRILIGCIFFALRATFISSNSLGSVFTLYVIHTHTVTLTTIQKYLRCLDVPSQCLFWIQCCSIHCN